MSVWKHQSRRDLVLETLLPLSCLPLIDQPVAWCILGQPLDDWDPMRSRETPNSLERTLRNCLYQCKTAKKHVESWNGIGSTLSSWCSNCEDNAFEGPFICYNKTVFVWIFVEHNWHRSAGDDRWRRSDCHYGQRFRVFFESRNIERGLDPLFGPLGRSPVARTRGLDASQYLRLALDTDVYFKTMSICQSQHKDCKARKRRKCNQMSWPKTPRTSGLAFSGAVCSAVVRAVLQPLEAFSASWSLLEKKLHLREIWICENLGFYS